MSSSKISQNPGILPLEIELGTSIPSIAGNRTGHLRRWTRIAREIRRYASSCPLKKTSADKPWIFRSKQHISLLLTIHNYTIALIHKGNYSLQQETSRRTNSPLIRRSFWAAVKNEFYLVCSFFSLNQSTLKLKRRIEKRAKKNRWNAKRTLWSSSLALNDCSNIQKESRLFLATDRTVAQIPQEINHFSLIFKWDSYMQIW